MILDSFNIIIVYRNMPFKKPELYKVLVIKTLCLIIASITKGLTGTYPLFLYYVTSFHSLFFIIHIFKDNLSLYTTDKLIDISFFAVQIVH